MTWFALIALAFIIWVAALIIGKAASSDREIGAGGGLLIAGGGTALALFVAGCSTVVASTHEVPAGHVGVVYQYGAIVDQTGDGLVWTAPWREVKNANVQIQAYEFHGEEAITAASIETQDIYFTATLNYSVSPNAIQSLYRDVGPDYFNKLIRSRVNQIFKDETVQYLAIEVTQKRDEIRDAVVARLRAELEPFSINVDSLQIDNIDYSDEFNASIEAKQVATQDALREQERVKQAEYQAQQAAAVAQGESDALRIRAEGQAEANRLLAESLSPEIIQYEAIQKLAPNVQIALIPSGDGLIIDPSSILQP